MASSLYKLRREIVEAGRRVYARNYVASNDGNISARIDSRKVVITPSGVSKGFMSPEDLIVVDYNGNVLEGRKKPSSEVFMHLQIYKDRPDVNGVVHAHPPKATGFAVAGIPLTQCVLPEVIVGLGGIPLAEYGTPGTDEFYKPVLKYLKDYDAFLLENHGALTIGADVMNAYYKMETLEHFAHIAFTAIQLGNLGSISPPNVQKLLDLRQRFGIKTQVSCESCEKSDEGSCTVQAETQPAPAKSPQRNGSKSVDQEALIQSVTQAVLKQLAG
ncbi:MAG: class II aldolase/adducin family protein [Acidobacteriota bacterium]|nr:MAG: class II aldolase/adducin family protein [Acidobacteriota bacterium]